MEKERVLVGFGGTARGGTSSETGYGVPTEGRALACSPVRQDLGVNLKKLGGWECGRQRVVDFGFLFLISLKIIASQ